jgi:hypothetical protein
VETKGDPIETPPVQGATHMTQEQTEMEALKKAHLSYLAEKDREAKEAQRLKIDREDACGATPSGHIYSTRHMSSIKRCVACDKVEPSEPFHDE